MCAATAVGVHATAGVQRLDGEAAGVDGGEDAARTRVGGALAAALDDLRRVPRRTGGHAAHQRDRGDDSGVGGPSGEDDVGARLQRRHDRLGAHHPDDVRAALQRGGVQRALRSERVDAAGVELRHEVGGVLLAVDAGHGERQVLLAQDPLHDAGHPVDARVGAPGAARADDQRDARSSSPVSSPAPSGGPACWRRSRPTAPSASTGTATTAPWCGRCGPAIPPPPSGWSPGHAQGGLDALLARRRR
jgi:hypothetical protein